MSSPLLVVPVAILVCPRCEAPLIVAEPIAVPPPVALTECDAPELSPRQREVLVGLAGGRSMVWLAHDMGIGVSTVETHRAHLMERLGIHDIAGLTRYVVGHGWRIP